MSKTSTKTAEGQKAKPKLMVSRQNHFNIHEANPDGSTGSMVAEALYEPDMATDLVSAYNATHAAGIDPNALEEFLRVAEPLAKIWDEGIDERAMGGVFLIRKDAQIFLDLKQAFGRLLNTTNTAQ